MFSHSLTRGRTCRHQKLPFRHWDQSSPTSHPQAQTSSPASTSGFKFGPSRTLLATKTLEIPMAWRRGPKARALERERERERERGSRRARGRRPRWLGQGNWGSSPEEVSFSRSKNIFSRSKFCAKPRKPLGTKIQNYWQMLYKTYFPHTRDSPSCSFPLYFCHSLAL